MFVSPFQDTLVYTVNRGPRHRYFVAKFGTTDFLKVAEKIAGDEYHAPGSDNDPAPCSWPMVIRFYKGRDPVKYPEPISTWTVNVTPATFEAVEETR